MFRVQLLTTTTDNFKLRKISGGLVVVVCSPHPQMTGTFSYRPEEIGGRQRGFKTSGDWTTDIAFYRDQRLHGVGLFARRPVRCVPLTPAHRKMRSLW
ncbi:hypothetical protein TNCV_1875991 [Trichonephila clavipes]|nr:hypothetical protein TNCV_1875991 [Trichonephila clavipes]